MNQYRVAAQGRWIVKLGRSSWPLVEANGIAGDLRARGYADAHVQRADAGVGPLALTLVALLAAGCGGVPFETPFEGDGDAGVDARASLSPDARGEASDPTPDAQGDELAAVDAGVCTPIPTAPGQRAYACASDPNAGGTIPADFAWQTQGLPVACGVGKTPAACMCLETYTCACLRRAGVCDRIGGEIDAGGLTWFACNDTDTNMPTVTCLGH